MILFTVFKPVTPLFRILCYINKTRKFLSHIPHSPLFYFTTFLTHCHASPSWENASFLSFCGGKFSPNDPFCSLHWPPVVSRERGKSSPTAPNCLVHSHFFWQLRTTLSRDGQKVPRKYLKRKKKVFPPNCHTNGEARTHLVVYFLLTVRGQIFCVGRSFSLDAVSAELCERERERWAMKILGKTHLLSPAPPLWRQISLRICWGRKTSKFFAKPKEDFGRNQVFIKN